MTRTDPVAAAREALLTTWTGLGRWPTVMFDLAVAMTIVTFTVNDSDGWVLDPVVGLLMAAALLGRRYRPVPVFAVVAGLGGIQVLLTDSAPAAYDMAVLVAMVAVVSHAQQSWATYLAGLVVLAGLVLIGLRGSLIADLQEHSASGLIEYAAVLAGFSALWLTAFVLRTRRLLVAGLRERAATAERERDQLNRLALADERAGIARELHDVVAHSLAVMILQADGAGYVVVQDVAKAQNALRTIADTGREALEDMHRIVDVLRGTAPGALSGDPDSPGPDRRRITLEQLRPLVERAGSAGLNVSLSMDEPPSTLTAAEELTLVRLAQESLTNVLRHAGPGAPVEVSLRFTADTATLEVSDRGTGRTGGPPARSGPVRAGSGLIGMRERVSAHGGTFVAGPGRQTGDPGTAGLRTEVETGWTIRATIPVRRPV